VFVCVVTRVCCAKTAERIEMPFAGQTRAGPRSQVLDGAPGYITAPSGEYD